MLSMKEQFEQTFEGFKKKVAPEVLGIMDKAINDVASIASSALKEGEKAPDFSLPDATGKDVRLSEELKNGPVVLTFYRGGWCPYCNMELRAYQNIMEDIHKAGGQLIAVSPESPDQSLNTKEKHDLKFHVLSDKGNQVADLYNLVYRLHDDLIDLYKKFNINLDSHNGDESWTLPISATYVISQQGKIVFAHASADYKDRAEPTEVLEYLKKLK